MNAHTSLTIREVMTSADLNRFLAFPYRFYDDDPHWVPLIRILEKHRLSSRNAFFKEADIKLFFATRGSDVVGTISVLRDRGLQQHKGEQVVWFGYFECINDPEIAAALLGHASDQARTWGGMTLRGPRNLTRWESMGLTIEGHHTLPPFLQGHHPTWYQNLIEAAGFCKHHDVLAYETPLVDAEGRPRELPAGLRTRAQGCDIPGLVVRRARWRGIQQDLLRIHRVLNEASKTVPDLTPMPERTFLAMGRAYLMFVNTRLVQIGLVHDEPVAFALCMPELNEAFITARGYPAPVSWLRIALALRQVRTASFKLIAVNPQFRGTGLHALLIQHVIEGVRQAGYRRLEASVIDERNAPMRAVVEHAGCTIYRRYRVYERQI
jgi:GNAT superfamily N-acetyltransferase